MNWKLVRSITICAVLLSTAAACSEYTQKFESSHYNYGTRDKERTRQLPDTKAYGVQSEYWGKHDNRKLYIDQPTADQISAMSGIAASIVMRTDSNAYVAVVLDNSATGTAAEGNRLDTDNTGTIEGMYDPISGSQYVKPNELVTKYNSYFTTKGHDDLSSDLRQKIAAKVRLENPYVQEVHISANRDFVNLLNRYAQEAWKGRSLDRYVNEFNQKMRGYFGGTKMIRPGE